MSEFKDFRACPVCQEQSEQCLTCASYVVDGERIYYEKLKDFGATQDYELRFIQRIQKHRTTAFFHKGKLYIPSRQGRSVPLAIGLQWEAWQEQQAKVDELQKRVDDLESKLQIKTRHSEFFEQSRKGHRGLAILRKKQINSALEQIEKLYVKAESDYEKERNPYYDGMLSALDLAEQAIRGELAEQALKGEGQ